MPSHNSRFAIPLGALALVAGLAAFGSPAQAQGWGGFGFGFGWDNDNRSRGFQLCILTENELRRTIRNAGYTNVTMAPNNRGLTEARGTQGGWVYLLTVRSCTGEILERRRLRPA